jgi:acyl-CoA synthetase (AMP-forming)/AMP-acid ligase II
VAADQQWGTIPAVARAAADRFGAAEAIADGDTRLSYTDVVAQADRAARAFVGAGIEPGDRVAIWAPNIWEWVIALLGLQSAGAVLVPLNSRYKGTEAGYILGKSRAKVLATVEGFLGNDYVSMLHSAAPNLPDLERIVVLRGIAPEGSQSWEEFLAGGDDIEQSVIDDRVATLGPDDLSDILFTSGTTGNPKGVMCTHGQTIRAFAAWSEIVGLREGDRYLIVNPFFHAFGYKAGIVAALVRGATIVPEPVFDVPAVMKTVVDERITMLPGTPALYQTILNHPDFDSFDFSTLRLAVTGAAAIPVQLIRDMWDKLGFETVVTGYGLTESTGIATMCRHDDDAETIATTSGRAIPDVEVQIVDDDSNEVPRGEAGEVVVRGYNVMSAYFEEPEQTEATIDDHGWLHTGDIGVMDDRGYIMITDRKKDMFIVGGFNAYPAEIENLLLAHDDIAQVAVVGIPDGRLGEIGVAFVVPTSGHDPDADELHAWARETMANFKVPRHFRFVEALPLNPSGKVLKYQLRDEAVAELAGGLPGGVRR